MPGAAGQAGLGLELQRWPPSPALLGPPGSQDTGEVAGALLRDGAPARRGRRRTDCSHPSTAKSVPTGPLEGRPWAGRRTDATEGRPVPCTLSPAWREPHWQWRRGIRGSVRSWRTGTVPHPHSQSDPGRGRGGPASHLCYRWRRLPPQPRAPPLLPELPPKEALVPSRGRAQRGWGATGKHGDVLKLPPLLHRHLPAGDQGQDVAKHPPPRPRPKNASSSPIMGNSPTSHLQPQSESSLVPTTSHPNPPISRPHHVTSAPGPVTYV